MAILEIKFSWLSMVYIVAFVGNVTCLVTFLNQFYKVYLYTPYCV